MRNLQCILAVAELPSWAWLLVPVGLLLGAALLGGTLRSLHPPRRRRP